mmetsp:Transcript_6548/g.25407  ORF Transcript_6548/g.25407 Transcript_6548/m.25407 type:complete len:256 (+) Transcript_6548:3225-3992(+)
MMAPMDGISTWDPPRGGEPLPAELTPPRRPSRLRVASPQKAAARASLATGSPAFTAATGASKTTHSPRAMALVATTFLSPGSPTAAHASQPGPKSRAARCSVRVAASASSSESEPDEAGPSGRVPVGRAGPGSGPGTPGPASSSFVAVGSSAAGASAAGSSTTGTVTLSCQPLLRLLARMPSARAPCGSANRCSVPSPSTLDSTSVGRDASGLPPVGAAWDNPPGSTPAPVVISTHRLASPALASGGFKAMSMVW